MKGIKFAAKASLETILYVIYKICRAFIIWYQEDKRDEPV